MTHEQLDATDLRTRDVYRLMTDLVAPRPIAWVGTVDSHGRPNLAPFSYYQAVCSSPPTVVVSIGWRGDGRPKDSLANILETGVFTVSHVHRALAEAMNETSAALPHGESEWDHAQVAASAGTCGAAPWVGAAHAAMECAAVQAVPLGTTRHGTPSSTLIIGEVRRFHVREGLLTRDDAGRINPIDPRALDSVGRLGGMAYTETKARFELQRPPTPESTK